MATFCGDHRLKAFTSSNNTVFVRFKSDSVGGSGGFTLAAVAVTTPGMTVIILTFNIHTSQICKIVKV